MFLTTHATVGTLISQQFNDPMAIFGLSFASHFFLDFIPHGDEEFFHDTEWKILKRYKRVTFINAIDVTLLIALSFWTVARTDLPNTHLMIIGIFGSVLPDFLSFFFPVIHERFSWLALVRWLYKLTKPTGIRYVVRGNNWLHQLLHHEIIRKDIPFTVGLLMQIFMIVAILTFLIR